MPLEDTKINKPESQPVYGFVKDKQGKEYRYEKVPESKLSNRLLMKINEKKTELFFQLIYKIGYTIYKVDSARALQREIDEGNLFVTQAKRGKNPVFQFFFMPKFFDDYGNWDYKDRVKHLIGREVDGPDGTWKLVLDKNRVALQFEVVKSRGSVYDEVMYIALQLRYVANTEGSFEGFTEDKAKN
jgi:hypothetical protein